MKEPAQRSDHGLRFAAVSVLATLLVLAACFALFQREAGGIDQRLRDRETIRLGMQAHVLRSDLRSVTNDLRGLVEGDGLQAFLARGDPADLARATHRAAFFSRLHREYDQVRFLDEHGREILRVNQGGAIVLPGHLLDHTDQSCFKKALPLGPAELFVSALDLNVEQGRIEEPLKPVIRFAMPVFDAAGRRRGLYVINLLGAEFIRRLQQAAPALQHRLRVLNAQGYWLKADRPEREWGFALPDRVGESLARTDARLWAQIAQASEGQQRLGGGLFTWRRIVAQDFADGDVLKVVAEDDFLVLASEVSAAEWTDLFSGVRGIFFVIAPGLLLLAGSSMWFFQSRRTTVQSLRESEENLAVTLHSIGDAVLATDAAGKITRMNPIAEQLTGWDFAAARGRPIAEVFRIAHGDTRQPAVIPVDEVLATGKIHGLANHTILIARDGTERSIADSAAPIRDRRHQIVGVVLVFRDVTAERRAENIQAHFAAIVASSEDAIISKNLDGVITSWNAGATRMFGYAAAEAVGQPISLIVPVQHADEETRILAGIADGEPVAQLETVRRRKDGSPIDVSVTISPLRNRQGGITGVSSIARDITRARRAAEQLRKSADEIRDLYNLAPCGYHSLDADGVVIAMNDTELNWLGHRREKVVGRMRIADLLTEESRGIFQATFPRFKHDGAITGLELRMLRRDGSILHALVNATAIYDANGQFVSSRSSVFDITARKEIEEELDRFFSLSLDFLCISSDDGYFKRVSPAVTAMLGWTVPEFLAQPYLDLVHPDDLEKTVHEVEKQVHGGQTVLNFENRYRHKDGSWRTLSWRSIPQPGGLMYATARDVTEARRREEDIRLLNTELLRRAAQLEFANKELESFSYSVSHDLRAPLRHIQGYVEMLTREAQAQLTEKGRRYLKTIADAGHEMGELIDDLLMFSRMGRTELRTALVELDSLVSDTRRSLELPLQGRRIEWKISPLPKVRGDAAMLKQVWANLLGNAVKYTRHRDPAVIEIGCAGAEDGRLVFFVRDNGAGFDMRYADKLFGVFQRLHRADEFEGNGIGLASVRRIIARHGGRTWAEGKPDAGAVFYFTLEPATSVRPPASPP